MSAVGVRLCLWECVGVCGKCVDFVCLVCVTVYVCECVTVVYVLCVCVRAYSLSLLGQLLLYGKA